MLRRSIGMSVAANLLLSFATVAEEDAAKNYALLVGVTKYDHSAMNEPKLDFPEEDAKALGELLRDGGYEVGFLLGAKAKLATIRAAVESVRRKGSADSVLVIGLFGHGVEIEADGGGGQGAKDGYFCPFDADIRVAKDSQGKTLFLNGKEMLEPVPTSLFPVKELLSMFTTAKAGSRVVFVDCCRQVPNQARGRSLGTTFRVQDLPSNTSILFGCSPNEQAFEHKDWSHGAFTKCLLQEIRRLSASGSVETANLAGLLKQSVPKLVASVSPRDRQIPKFFATDSVDLRLRFTMPPPVVHSSRSTGMKFALIPAGTFQMGSSLADVRAALQADSILKEEYLKREQPQHPVRITQPFYMGVYEVTQGEYESVMGTNPSWFSKTGSGSDKVSNQNTSTFPVEEVSWFDAVEFCNKLSAKDGLTPAYRLVNIERAKSSIKKADVTLLGQPGSVSAQTLGYRLPTEAEWEYACRAGTTTAFHFGSVLNGDQANVDGNFPFGTTTKGKYRERPTTVGSYAKNPMGLFDMHGNVWEWCEDMYDKQAYSGRAGVTENPLVVQGSEIRVLRGGSWGSDSRYSRSALRNGLTPDNRSYDVGFRVVLPSRTR